jgi:hypothetical protein
MIEKSPILITGAARSGTSLISGSVHLCGAFGGVMRRPNQNNSKGMFENARIVESITKPYLRSIGMDPLGQYPLPKIEGLPIPSDWRKKVEAVMLEEGYKGGPWFYKGAKMCLTWPIWHYAFPKSRWIIVRRRTGDIASSCCNTGFMRAFSNPRVQREVGVNNERDGWIWWVNKHLERFREMQDNGLDIKIIWPERMVDGDFSQIMELIDWLRLKWNDDVYSFVSPKLWNSKLRKYCV